MYDVVRLERQRTGSYLTVTLTKPMEQAEDVAGLVEEWLPGWEVISFFESGHEHNAVDPMDYDSEEFDPDEYF